MLKAAVLLVMAGNTLRRSTCGDFTELMKASSLAMARVDTIAYH